MADGSRHGWRRAWRGWAPSSPRPSSSLRPRRIPAPAGASVLVPIVRRRHGNGLAFLGHHHQRSRRAQARPGSARRRTGLARLRRSRKAFAAARRTNCAPSANASASMATMLATASRLVAKVDSAAVQDGFDLYLHGFIRRRRRQMGRRAARHERRQQNRRAAITGISRELEKLRRRAAQRRSRDRRRAKSSISPIAARRRRARSNSNCWFATGPDRIVARARRADRRITSAGAGAACRHLIMPAHHDVAPKTMSSAAAARHARRRRRARTRRFCRAVADARRRRRTVRALAMVAEVVHGAPYRFSDPARFSLAHGGKDRHPFPVPIKVYDETIRVLKAAVPERKAWTRRGDAGSEAT